MPYGKELRNKTLRPNANHFAKGVDKLIDILSLYVNGENIQIIENIRSLRANQIRELGLKTDNSFEKFGINIQMEDLYNELQMHVRSFLALTQIQKLNFKGS
ncbi:MAG: hypothetical protein K2O24_09390 [Muribaculaceae bacterium]|nr:hypothetical protein [Muribaculaceae bacterium]